VHLGRSNRDPPDHLLAPLNEFSTSVAAEPAHEIRIVHAHLPLDRGMCVETCGIFP
jgi:hypothetical protein